MIAINVSQQEFEKNLKSESSALEYLRKKLAFKVLITFGFRILILLSALAWVTWKLYQFAIQEFSISNDYKLILAFVALLFFFYFLAVIYLYKKWQKNIYKYLYHGEYAMRYKKEVLERAIPNMVEGLSYSMEEGIAKADFSESGFPSFGSPARYYSSGKITGTFGKSTFTFAEVLAEEFIKDENSNRQYSDLFRGVFFIIDFHKNTSWNTFVYPDTIKYFSPFLLGQFSEEKEITRKKFQRVKLEDVEFEKYFEVYGNDQTESRYLLSPALMARIVDFKKRSKKSFQLSFKGSKVYFGVYYPMGKGLFTPPLFKPVYDLQTLELYISQIRLMTGFVKELNLNAELT